MGYAPRRARRSAAVATARSGQATGRNWLTARRVAVPAVSHSSRRSWHRSASPSCRPLKPERQRDRLCARVRAHACSPRVVAPPSCLRSWPRACARPARSRTRSGSCGPARRAAPRARALTQRSNAATISSRAGKRSVRDQAGAQVGDRRPFPSHLPAVDRTPRARARCAHRRDPQPAHRAAYASTAASTPDWAMPPTRPGRPRGGSPARARPGRAARSTRSASRHPQHRPR